MSAAHIRRFHLQEGQALAAGLALAAIGGLALFALHHLGQTAQARARLTHAADAAAYSGAVLQARHLNYLAYANRTQVAHQIAMAHLVTLAASAQQAATMQARHGRAHPPAGLIAMLFGPSLALAYGSAREQPGALARLASAFALHDRAAQVVVEAEARRAQLDLPRAREQRVREVIEANLGPGSTHGSVALHWLSDGWPGFVYAARSQVGGFLRQTVHRAAGRYGFLQRRDFTRRNAWPVSYRCPLRRHELRRRGFSWLDMDGRWGALDTQSFHALRSNRWIGCYYREYAMGWGATQGRNAKPPPGTDYVENPPADFSQEDFWRWVAHTTSWDIFSGKTNPLANSFAMFSAARWKSAGLPPYREVQAARHAHALRFAVALKQRSGAPSPSVAAGVPHGILGQIRLAVSASAPAVTVTSAAETYFSRPGPRSDGKDELASLFRPYWQARLSAVTPREAASARRLP